MIYKESERMITCTRTDGKPVRVPAEKLVLRPAAYAVLPHEEQILLVNTSYTTKYFLPGGRVRLGECVEDALRRKLMEEAGVEVDIHQFCGFRERFFFDESINQAFHGLLFYYLCALRGQQPLAVRENEPRGVTAHWTPITSLRENDFQYCGDFVMEIIKRKTPSGETLSE